MRRTALILPLLCLLAGCHVAPPYVQPASSMVFDSPELAARTWHDPMPWYADRNDIQPGVMAGPQLPIISSTYSWTYDAQSNSSRNVYDHYSRRTYGFSASQSVQ